MTILVSVLIAAYHAQQHIARSVSSVLQQNYPTVEIIIASDDQTDYQRLLYDQGIQDPRLRFVSTGQNGSGPSKARNSALRVAKGEVAAILDADDTMGPDKIYRLLTAVLKFGAATSNVCLVDSYTSEMYPSLAPPFPTGLLTPEEYICANIHAYSILLWDRKRCEGNWNEDLCFLEDLVHGLRMYDVFDGIFYDSNVLHHYYKGAATITNQTESKILAGIEHLNNLNTQKRLPLYNGRARHALTLYLAALLPLERKFFLETQTHSVMGFYNFMARNRDAFFNWTMT